MEAGKQGVGYSFDNHTWCKKCHRITKHNDSICAICGEKKVFGM